MDQSELLAAVSALTDSVGELSRRLDVQEELVHRIEAQRRGLHSTRIVLGCAVVGLILDLVLTLGFGLLFQRVDENSLQVREVQQRTSTQILCPLYEVIATSIKTDPSPPNLTPDELQVRHDAGNVIANGLKTLGCA